MSPSSVAQLLTQDARLLARRNSPSIDQELEAERQQALDLFFQFQDGLLPFTELTPFIVLIQRKVDLNRALLKWEQEHLVD